jgi:hypothetical protein
MVLPAVVIDYQELGNGIPDCFAIPGIKLVAIEDEPLRRLGCYEQPSRLHVVPTTRHCGKPFDPTSLFQQSLLDGWSTLRHANYNATASLTPSLCER